MGRVREKGVGMGGVGVGVGGLIRKWHAARKS